MKRKVIKQGSGAYTITLPISWVRQNNIDNNTELELTEENKFLTIKTNSLSESKKIKLELETYEKKHIYRVLMSLYSKGLDEITIKSKRGITKELIEILNSLPGYSLVNQKEQDYEIKDIYAGSYPRIEETFKRTFQAIIKFYEDACEDVFGEEKADQEEVELRDREINKLCLYLQRAINKSSYRDNIEGRTIFAYSFELEKIGDEINRFWRTNVKYKTAKSKEMNELAEMTKECIEKAFDLFFQFNYNHIEEVYKNREEVRNKYMKIKPKNEYQMRMIRHLVNISEAVADLTQLTIMMNSKEV